MIDEIFNRLGTAVEGAGLLAVAAAFVWGLLSIILSPCHLAGIPLIIGYLGQYGSLTLRRAFSISFMFSLGIMLTIALIGFITRLAGRMMGDLGGWSNIVVAIVFIVFGLMLLGVIKFSWSAPGKINLPVKGPWGGFLIGLVFGIAVGPCTFAFMGPMLGVAAFDHTRGAVLLGAYAIGHCGLIVLAGCCMELVQKFMDFNANSKASIVMRKICGILIIIAGLYMVVK